MREFLLNSCAPGIRIICILELLEILILWNMFRKNTGKQRYCILSAMLIGVGLFIDAFLISLGASLSKETLLAVSPLRFIAHGLLIPLIFVICGYALGLSERAMKIVWIFTAVVMVIGCAEGFSNHLEVREIAGVIRCASDSLTPAWATKVSTFLSFGTVLPLIAVGVVRIVRKKGWAVFFSGFLMFVSAAIGPATGNIDLLFYISMYGELAMLTCFILYLRKA